jgi:hypothetical protein
MATSGNMRYQFRYGNEPGTVVYEGPISMTTATVASPAIKGVSAVTYTSTGAFTITLNRFARALRSFSATHYASTGALLSIIPAGLPATAHTDAQAGSVKYVCVLASTGVRTNVVATDVIWVQFVLGTSMAGAR